MGHTKKGKKRGSRCFGAVIVIPPLILRTGLMVSLNTPMAFVIDAGGKKKKGRMSLNKQIDGMDILPIQPSQIKWGSLLKSYGLIPKSLRAHIAQELKKARSYPPRSPDRAFWIGVARGRLSEWKINHG